VPAVLGRRARGARRLRPRPLHQHHRGLDRRLSRGGQQAPRGRDQRRGRRIRGTAHGGRPPVTESSDGWRRGAPPPTSESGQMIDGEGADPRYEVATIPGDGVGPDVVSAARRVVDAAGQRFGFTVEWTEYLVGGAAIDAYGVAIRPEDVEACGDAEAILLGAVGGPKWSDPSSRIRPEQALFALRGGLGLYANLRPVTVHPALIAPSPPRPELLAGVDMLIVRELTGGIYFGDLTEASGEPGSRTALDTLPYAEHEIARIV